MSPAARPTGPLSPAAFAPVSKSADAAARTGVRCPPRPDTLDFPGCIPVRLTRDAVEDHDGRLEYWDAALETAWVCEPTSPWHEAPCARLAGLVERIAAIRGSPIECFGNMDLEVSDADGRPQRILQADQVVYLDPRPEHLPGSRSLVLGEHAFPDVLLEVDHSTDVRRSKLGLYESWGFPELWVEVPERRSASRPRSRKPGLTIHVLDGGAYRSAPASAALPGWTAAEIHTALNEPVLSPATMRALERVGGRLGAREGTGPEDDLLLRSQRRAGREEGYAAGRTAGYAAGRRDELTAAIVGVMRTRGIEFAAEQDSSLTLPDLPRDVLLAAAIACADEEDFWRRLGLGPRP